MFSELFPQSYVSRALFSELCFESFGAELCLLSFVLWALVYELCLLIFVYRTLLSKLAFFASELYFQSFVSELRFQSFVFGVFWILGKLGCWGWGNLPSVTGGTVWGEYIFTAFKTIGKNPPRQSQVREQGHDTKCQGFDKAHFL